MSRWLLALALLTAACAAEPAAPPEPAPAPAPAPAPEPEPAAPEPAAPEPVALTAELTAEGGTVSVTGTSNLPDGAALLYELTATDGGTYDERQLLYEGDAWSGSVQVTGGTYALTLTGDGWDGLGLCDRLTLELWVSYYPLRAVDTLPVQPDELYALHGEQGELLVAAVPPAELVQLPVPDGSQRVELVTTCP